jgi:hypothetical protein
MVYWVGYVSFFFGRSTIIVSLKEKCYWLGVYRYCKVFLNILSAKYTRFDSQMNIRMIENIDFVLQNIGITLGR